MWITKHRAYVYGPDSNFVKVNVSAGSRTFMSSVEGDRIETTASNTIGVSIMMMKILVESLIMRNWYPKWLMTIVANSKMRKIKRVKREKKFGRSCHKVHWWKKKTPWAQTISITERSISYQRSQGRPSRKKRITWNVEKFDAYISIEEHEWDNVKYE